MPDDRHARFRERHRETLREYQRQWKAARYAADPEPMREARREHWAKHHDRLNAARRDNPEPRRAHHARRYATDENFRIAAILRATLRAALINRRRGTDWKAGAKFGAIVGCSKPDLITHIESQFLPGMSWVNYGRNGWEIDHIKAVATFDLTQHDQVLACFHFKNLRPLWRPDNLRKGNREL
jgi:hypothetical protein